MENKALPGREIKKVIIIMALITITEGIWVFVSWMQNGYRFWKYLGFTSPVPLTGWLAALLVAAVFVFQAMRLPAVKHYLLRMSGLKLLALCLAFSASILEEVFFRKELMNYLQAHNYGWMLQVLISGCAFGSIHSVWGLFGKNIRAATGATLATGILGCMLALVYLASERILAPCIAAHFLIDALMEPGLVIAAVKGEMSNRNKTNQFNASLKTHGAK